MQMRMSSWVRAVVALSSVVAVTQAGVVQAQTSATPSSTASTTTTSAARSTAEGSTSSSGTSTVQLPDGGECPAVQLVAVNGTTESSKNSDTDADTGWMARVVTPAVRAANADGETRLSRTYVPYPASFGGFLGSTDAEDQASYAESVTTGVENGRKLIAQTVERCPETKIFVSGYSQGAQVASAIVRDIGAGEGPIAPEQIAGAALMSDPTRAADAPIFQGDASRVSPASVPGTEGEAVSSIDIGEQAPTPEGRGISPNTAAADFGAVADRVASFCVPGDLACDTPPGSDLFQVVANIAGQSESGGDPVRALANVAEVTGQSVLFTAAETISEDVEYSDGAGFTIAPASQGNTTLSRMARYSDPTRSQNPADQTALLVEAGTKLAGMALGASITVAKKTLTPANIAQIAAAGAAAPQAGAAALAAKLAVSASEVITPATVDSALRRAAGEIKHTITDTAGVVDMATKTAVDAHSMYDRTPFSASGQSAAAIAQRWVVAAASDIAASRGMEPVAQLAAVGDADRMELIRSGSGADELSQLASQTQDVDATGLSEALASVTA